MTFDADFDGDEYTRHMGHGEPTDGLLVVSAMGKASVFSGYLAISADGANENRPKALNMRAYRYLEDADDFEWKAVAHGVVALLSEMNGSGNYIEGLIPLFHGLWARGYTDLAQAIVRKNGGVNKFEDALQDEWELIRGVLGEYHLSKYEASLRALGDVSFPG